MRAILFAAVAASALTLSGCGAPGDSGGGSHSANPVQTAEVMQDPSPDASARAKSSDAGGAAPVKVTLPQLAYAYKLGFLVPGAKIGDIQEAHRAMCEAMGPARCQLLALERGNSDDARTAASLKLRVVTSEASRFSKDMTRVVDEFGGRSADTNVAAEDVSKDIVDARARIRQRELLVARLTELLRTRKGTVGELLEAERSVARAQEELDQTKAWLAELGGRVAMSEFEIRYTAIAASASAQGMGGQLTEAAQDSGAGFLIGLRMLFTILIYLAPWALLAFPVIWLIRRANRRIGTPPA